MKGKNNGHDYPEQAFDYAWNWFEYHATQRLEAFRFFILIAGALAAGYGVCLRNIEHHRLIGLFLATSGATISIAFWLIDIRNAELVEIGREALKNVENITELRIREVDKRRSCLDRAVGPFSDVFPPDCTKYFARHWFWFRLIHLSALHVSAFAFYFAWINFDSSNMHSQWSSLFLQGFLTSYAYVYLVMIFIDFKLYQSEIKSIQRHRPISIGIAA